MILIEPNLNFSKPDLVLVFWEPETSSDWPFERNFLQKNDFKLIQFLYQRKEASMEEIFGIFQKKSQKSLQRLESANIIYEENSNWCLNPISSIFSINRIISIEAKLSFSKVAIRQAYENFTFSSNSFVLTKTNDPGKELRFDAERKGVGVISYSPGTKKDNLIMSAERKQPISYISWEFNNLVWANYMGYESAIRH